MTRAGLCPSASVSVGPRSGPGRIAPKRSHQKIGSRRCECFPMHGRSMPHNIFVRQPIETFGYSVNASIRNRLSFPSRPVRNRCCSVVTNHDFQKCPSLKGTSVIATINCGDFVDCENPTARMGGVSGLRGNMHATNMGRRKCCYSQNFEPFVDCASRRSAI